MRAALWPLAVVVVCGAVLAAEPDRAVDGQVSPPKVEKPKKKPSKPPQRITPQEETAARDFARQHHPELLRILDHLDKNLPNEYRHAINDLHKAATRIGQLKTRDSDRYELELESWKLRSRIQFLAAQLQLEPDDARLQAALRKALLEQADLQIAACEADRQRQAERLKQFDEQLRRLREEREKRVDKQIEIITRSKRRADPKGKSDHSTPKKPGAADKSAPPASPHAPKRPPTSPASSGKPDKSTP